MTPHMEVEVLEIAGVLPALLGLGLSYGKINHIEVADQMIPVARKLAGKNYGHDKFLESIMLWLDVRAPRYWWSQADTYRLSTKQSESTMHTLKKGVSPEDFEGEGEHHTQFLTGLLSTSCDLEYLKANLPEGFLQRRIWCMSLKTYINIRQQRLGHKLPHWRLFCYQVGNALKEQPILGDIWEHYINKQS